MALARTTTNGLNRPFRSRRGRCHMHCYHNQHLPQLAPRGRPTLTRSLTLSSSSSSSSPASPRLPSMISPHLLPTTSASSSVLELLSFASVAYCGLPIVLCMMQLCLKIDFNTVVLDGVHGRRNGLGPIHCHLWSFYSTTTLHALC